MRGRSRGGDPVSDYTAGRQVGDEQWRQEVKIASASRPSEPRPRPPRPGPGLGSRSYSGAWESHTPWRKVPSHPRERANERAHPPSLPAVSVGPCPACRGRKGGPEREEGRPGRRGRAEREQGWFSDACNSRLCPMTASRRPSGLALISKAPTDTPGSSRGTSHEKACLLRPLGP